MKKLMLVSFLLIASFQTFAKGESDSRVTKVAGAHYICTNEGGGGAYAIKVGSSPRLWQGDVDSNGSVTEGLELSNVKVQSLRCINCFDVTGDLVFFGEVIHVKGQLRGNMQVVKLDLTMTNGEGESNSFPQMDCQKGTAK